MNPIFPARKLQYATRKLRRRYPLRLAHYVIGSRRDDQFSVSFPRSGSTWFRAILCNVLLPEANGDPDIFNARIPSISLRGSPRISMMSDPRLLQTHSLFHPSINRAVYVVRDGRDALTSYFYYTTKRENLPFEKFADWYDYYEKGQLGPTWAEHVEGWLGHGRDLLKDNFFLLRYENMKREPEKSVSAALNFYGVEHTQAHLNAALEGASLEAGRKRELKEGNVSDQNSFFYRSGSVGDWQHLFDERTTEKFWEKNSKAMALGGYERS